MLTALFYRERFELREATQVGAASEHPRDREPYGRRPAGDWRDEVSRDSRATGRTDRPSRSIEWSVVSESKALVVFSTSMGGARRRVGSSRYQSGGHISGLNWLIGDYKACTWVLSVVQYNVWQLRLTVSSSFLCTCTDIAERDCRVVFWRLPREHLRAALLLHLQAHRMKLPLLNGSTDCKHTRATQCSSLPWLVSTCPDSLALPSSLCSHLRLFTPASSTLIHRQASGLLAHLDSTSWSLVHHLTHAPRAAQCLSPTPSPASPAAATAEPATSLAPLGHLALSAPHQAACPRTTPSMPASSAC